MMALALIGSTNLRRLRDSKLVFHPSCHACLRVDQSGMKRRVLASAFPHKTTFIENSDEEVRVVAMAGLKRPTELRNPVLKVRIRGWPGRFGGFAHHIFRSRL